MKRSTLLAHFGVFTMARMTHFEKDQILARLARENAELRAQVSQLQGDLGRVRRGPSAEEFRRRCEIRREASKRYFAAHPDKRSAAVAEILEWASANG